MSEWQDNLSVGLDVTFGGCADMKESIQMALNLGFNFIATHIFNPRLQRHFAAAGRNNGMTDNDARSLGRKRGISDIYAYPLSQFSSLGGSEDVIQAPATRSDMVLCSSDWSRMVVPILSPWIDVDSPSLNTRKASELAIEEELSFAFHLVTPIAMIIHLTSGNMSNLSRILYAHVSSPMRKAVWVVVPLISPKMGFNDVFEIQENDAAKENTGTDTGEADDPWKWWNSLHLMCGSHKKIIPIIELTAELPSCNVVDRWLGEPVKAVKINTRVFITNKKGFPVLPLTHQQLLKKFFLLDIQVLLCGRNRHGMKGLSSYRLYLNHLYQTREPADIITKFSKGYEDILQIPLQPLMDNLDSGTYEVFEKDPIKYTAYQEAIFNALIQRFGPMGDNSGPCIVVMILGAGRGPLVNCALRAASAAGKKINVYAVEKNKNAIITLQNMKIETWKDEVTIVSCDMRHWQAPELADIIVSELLGSFGDNELSPECLDGAQRFLKPDGISIPCRYTSYLSPIQSSKLWNDAKMAYKESGHVLEAALETPYVVRMLNRLVIDEPKPLFVFNHPNKNIEANLCNNRFCTLNFKAKQDCMLHGFAGYFDCVLYGDKVNLSIVPSTHSTSMVSWFPIYFPIHSPMKICSGDFIEVKFWRLSDSKKVWYEWLVTQPSTTSVHNTNARSCHIGL